MDSHKPVFTPCIPSAFSPMHSQLCRLFPSLLLQFAPSSVNEKQNSMDLEAGSEDIREMEM